MDKQIFTGQTYLDESRILPYAFKYEYMIPKWDIKRLIFIDTDNNYSSIEIDDAYQDISGDVEKYFDT